MRLDKWLKVSRLIKRRTAAGAVCADGRAFLNGRVAKAHSEVKPHDRLTLLFGGKTIEILVLEVPAGAISASSASTLYQVLPQPRSPIGSDALDHDT
ncbi:MAG: RNA-binding S4 domain-containing protein [Cyanobacteria bacterium REEB65]|nr:RNA-binding S4 domain-containing protein [Cyanobacteria bacterium REEB65]